MQQVEVDGNWPNKMVVVNGDRINYDYSMKSD